MASSTGPQTSPRRTGNVVLRGLDAFTDGLTAILFVFGAVAMFIMVVTRYGFSYSDPSVEIIVVYCMIWGTFVGIAAAVRFGVNIRFTLLEHLFDERGRRMIQTIANVITLLLALGLTVSGYTLAEETMMFDERMPTSLRWQVWPFHGAIFSGGILLSIQIVRSLVTLWSPGGEATSDSADGGVI
jgi:TRAP-type C4-dicarboxylate transport system permease small subunit